MGTDRLTGRRVLITGAALGIGAALAPWWIAPLLPGRMLAHRVAELKPMPDLQRTLLAATEELLADDDLSDATWEGLHDHLGDRGCVEFLLLAGNYRMLATTLHALRLPLDPRAA